MYEATADLRQNTLRTQLLRPFPRGDTVRAAAEAGPCAGFCAAAGTVCCGRACVEQPFQNPLHFIC